MYEKIQETASWLKARMKTNPKTAIILGTGLGQLASEITDKLEIPYSQIPNFPVSTVEGHAGALIFGKLGGVDIMAMQGRFHYYEGYNMKEVTFPVRVMYELGIKTLFVSNAAGGMNPAFKIGDLMVITDHINFFPEHPLRGKNFPTGPRFPDMHEAYDHELINSAFAALPSPKLIITTEKDVTRLKLVEGLSEEVRQSTYVLPINVCFLQNQADMFNHQIIDYVHKNSRNSILVKRKDDHKPHNSHHTGDRPRTISFRNN